MRDSRLDKLADILVNYSTKVKKGELVAIASDPIAMPLITAIAEQVIKAGGNPFWLPRSEDLTEILLTHGSDEQIAFCSPINLDIYNKIDVQIGTWTHLNTKYLARMDPKKIATWQQSRKPWFKIFMERSAAGKLRWVGTAYPGNASAQEANMSLTQYEEFVFRAGLLHLPDPAAEWRRIFTRQEQVREFLQTKKVLRFRVPAGEGPAGKHDGTDLTVDVSGRTWVNCHGESNFPDGEVFTGPRGVDGHVNYTFPAIYNGREVEGVRLNFKGGKVIDASARKGEDFLLQMLDQDAGARFLGEIAIGTNYGITEHTKDILFDEKIGGTFHAAVGAGYPETGNTNESALHWDMICDLRPNTQRGWPGGTIEADGEIFHRDGKFLRAGWPGNE